MRTSSVNVIDKYEAWIMGMLKSKIDDIVKIEDSGNDLLPQSPQLGSRKICKKYHDNSNVSVKKHQKLDLNLKKTDVVK